MRAQARRGEVWTARRGGRTSTRCSTSRCCSWRWWSTGRPGAVTARSACTTRPGRRAGTPRPPPLSQFPRIRSSFLMPYDPTPVGPDVGADGRRATLTVQIQGGPRRRAPSPRRCSSSTARRAAAWPCASSRAPARRAYDARAEDAARARRGARAPGRRVSVELHLVRHWLARGGVTPGPPRPPRRVPRRLSAAPPCGRAARPGAPRRRSRAARARRARSPSSCRWRGRTPGGCSSRSSASWSPRRRGSPSRPWCAELLDAAFVDDRDRALLDRMALGLLGCSPCRG
jgi:hypothetical protein